MKSKRYKISYGIKYGVRYGFNEGFGGNGLWKEISAKNKEEATEIASKAAFEYYANHAGMHSRFSVEKFIKENPKATKLDIAEARHKYELSWIHYDVVRVYNDKNPTSSWPIRAFW